MVSQNQLSFRLDHNRYHRLRAEKLLGQGIHFLDRDVLVVVDE